MATSRFIVPVCYLAVTIVWIPVIPRGWLQPHAGLFLYPIHAWGWAGWAIAVATAATTTGALTRPHRAWAALLVPAYAIWYFVGVASVSGGV